MPHVRGWGDGGVSPANYSPCRSCATPVFWVLTRKGAKMPLDESPERGNVVLDETSRAHVFRDHAAAVEAMEERPDIPLGDTYISHHAEGQCPQGPEWQGKTRGDADAPKAAPQLDLDGGLERARSFARSVAERGYPHSGAIEDAGAAHVEGSEPEAWRVGNYVVLFDQEGVRLREAEAA